MVVVLSTLCVSFTIHEDASIEVSNHRYIEGFMSNQAEPGGQAVLVSSCSGNDSGLFHHLPRTTYRIITLKANVISTVTSSVERSQASFPPANHDQIPHRERDDQRVELDGWESSLLSVNVPITTTVPEEPEISATTQRARNPQLVAACSSFSFIYGGGLFFFSPLVGCVKEPTRCITPP